MTPTDWADKPTEAAGVPVRQHSTPVRQRLLTVSETDDPRKITRSIQVLDQEVVDDLAQTIEAVIEDFRQAAGKMADMLDPVSFMGIAVVGDTIYAIGGGAVNLTPDPITANSVFFPPVEPPACQITLTGDVDQSETLTSADIIGLVNFVFKGGPAPQPCEAAGDTDCSGAVTSADIIGMVNHVFKGGVAPCDVCTLIPATWSCP